jgi:toxin YoeB
VNVCFQDQAWEDYLWWQQEGARGLKKLNRLIEECRRTPFEGTGQPEPLRHALAGLWSRRIDQEHRLVYAVVDDMLIIASCRHHYIT